jgi:hypothetical protein
MHEGGSIFQHSTPGLLHASTSYALSNIFTSLLSCCSPASLLNCTVNLNLLLLLLLLLLPAILHQLGLRTYSEQVTSLLEHAWYKRRHFCPAAAASAVQVPCCPPSCTSWAF